MRRLVASAAAVIVSLCGSVSPALADGHRPGTVAGPGQDRTSVVITNPGASSPGGSGEAEPSTRRVRRGGSSRSVPPHVVREERIQRQNEAGPACLRTGVTRRNTPMTPREEAQNEITRNSGENSGFDNCQRPGSGVEATQPSPAQVAEAFLRRVPLPMPEPRIAPDGQAITGLAAFLETNGALSHAASEPTPLGAVAVEATGAYFVDWGDGSPEAGPFFFEGEAYPTGRIFHHYNYTGTYTVTLRTSWSATWSLGGDSGVVEGLNTEEALPVEVFEVQAVIRR